VGKKNKKVTVRKKGVRGISFSKGGKATNIIGRIRGSLPDRSSQENGRRGPDRRWDLADVGPTAWSLLFAEATSELYS